MSGGGRKTIWYTLYGAAAIFISNKTRRGGVLERFYNILYNIYWLGRFDSCHQPTGTIGFAASCLAISFFFLEHWFHLCARGCVKRREREREWCVMCALLTPPSPLWMYYSVSNLSITLPQFFVSSGSSGNIKRLGETRRKGEDPFPLHQKHALFTRMITRLVGLS